MDRIHDKATKFFNDVRKKQVPMVKVQHNDCNKELPKLLLSSNNCCYCHKVFINSNYVLKHILRRHAEDFMSLHRKCLMKESNNNSCDAKYILDVIQNEFSAIRKELACRQNHKKSTDNPDLTGQNETTTAPERSELFQNVGNVHDNDECYEKHVGTTDKKYYTDISKSPPLVQMQSQTDIGSNEIDKSSDLERDLKILYNKFDVLNKEVKQENFSKKDVHNLVTVSENKIVSKIEGKFLEFEYNLQKDLHSMVSDQLRKTNIEWKSQFLELKEQNENLAYTVDLIRQKASSTDHLKATEKRLETQVVKFLGKNSQFENSFKTPEVLQTHSNLDSNSFEFGHGALSLQNKKTLSNKAISSIKECLSNDIQRNNSLCVRSHELSLGISPCTFKISSKDYADKMKQIENEKKQLGKQNQNFLKIFNKINMYADQRVMSNLKKKNPKLRFSKPLTLNKNVHKYNSKRSQNHNHTHPVPRNKISESLEPAILCKSICSKSNQKKFQNQTHPIFEYKSPTFSGTSALNKNCHQQSSQQNASSIKFQTNDALGSDHDILEMGGAGDGNYARSFIEVQRSKIRLHSTPLKEKEACSPFVDGDNFHVVKSVDESSNSVKPYINNTDDIYVSVSQDQLKAVDTLPDRKKEKNAQEIEAYDLTHLKNHSNDKFYLSNTSSLESLSSWDGDENNL